MLRSLADLLILCIFSVESFTFNSANSDRIVKGEVANITNFPFMLSLMVNKTRYEHHCGGSIIGSTWALTAAHCLIGKHESKFRIRSGTSSKNSGGKIHMVDEVHIHPNFNYKRKTNDIAVIKVFPRFKYGLNVKPIQLAEHTPPVETSCTISGWGKLSFHGPSSDELRYTTMQILPSNVCSEVYKDEFTRGMLCVGHLSEITGACMEDSGGPLVADKKLVGIISWGRGCGSPRFPGVNTDVAYFRPWILSVTGNL